MPAPCDRLDNPGDTYTIYDALLQLGYDVSLTQANQFWHSLSNAASAGWLSVPGRDEVLLDMIEGFINHNDPYWTQYSENDE